MGSSVTQNNASGGRIHRRCQSVSSVLPVRRRLCQNMHQLRHWTHCLVELTFFFFTAILFVEGSNALIYILTAYLPEDQHFEWHWPRAQPSLIRKKKLPQFKLWAKGNSQKPKHTQLGKEEERKKQTHIVFRWNNNPASFLYFRAFCFHIVA